jgi:DNA repair protein RecN (Recombination protein N)
MQSHIHPVTGERRVEEIARMLSGDPAGAESLEHARSMLEKFSIGKNAEDMHG